MRKYVKAASAAAVVCLSYAASAAQPLLPAGRGDQVPTRLVSVPVPAGVVERQPVSFSWALDPHASLSAPLPHVTESREYWQTVEGAELQSGVALKTSAPGAVIRVSPTRGSTPLQPADLGVRANGKAARLEQLADARALQAAGMDVNAGTAVVKLARGDGAGTWSLQAANARGRYVVHVFEPESDVVLAARPERVHALGGETIAVSMALTRAGKPVPAQAEALLVAPDGSSKPITVARDAAGTLSARVRLPVQASSAAGLWELQLFATGDGVSRDARTAFGVAAPTARIGDGVTADAARLRVSVPVVTGSAGRYEARGTLYATGSGGTLAPVSQAHSAAWIERGRGTLVLAFAREHLPAGYGAPYEVRQLELNDQARMASLEQRARAIRF